MNTCPNISVAHEFDLRPCPKCGSTNLTLEYWPWKGTMKHNLLPESNEVRFYCRSCGFIPEPSREPGVLEAWKQWNGIPDQHRKCQEEGGA